MRGSTLRHQQKDTPMAILKFSASGVAAQIAHARACKTFLPNWNGNHEMNLRVRLAKNIIDHRKSVGLSQENLARRAGVSPPTSARSRTLGLQRASTR